MTDADDHPNAERAREYLEVYASGSPEELAEFFDDDIEWRVGGYHPLSGTYRGKDAVVEYVRKTREQTEGTLRLDPESILASDKHLAMFIRVRATRAGASLDASMAQIVKLSPSGRWQEYWALADNQGAIDAFWS